jgi:ribosomal protein S18 acetylase RimI-like enzyme
VSAATVREASADELSAVGELTALIYLAAGHVAPGSPYLAELRDAPGRARHATVLVAEAGGGPAGAGGVIGTATLVARGGPLLEIARPGEAELRMLAVSPAARGRGVGTALVVECLHRARAAGCTGMVLSTHERMVAARRLYERLGFTRDPARDWEPVPGIQLRVYALDLSGSAG